MNKKVLSVAVLALMSASAVNAANNTVMYGKVHVSIDKFDSDASGADMFAVNDRGSRLGFKGSEDLGNGLKAIWKYEMSYDVDEGGAIGGARNSYLGLAGGFGTMLVGRHDTPAKVALYATGTEMLGDSIIQLTGSGDAALLNMQETRADDAIAYISPSMNGLTAAVAIIPGESAANDGLADSWSGAVMYKGHGVKAAAGYEDVVGAWELFNIGASVKFGDFTVGALWQSQEQQGGSGESDMYALTGKAKFGNNAVIATYASTENDGSLSGEGDGFGLALTHKMSKRSKIYVAYANKDVDGGTSVSSVAGDAFNQGSNFSVGMIHKF